MAVNLSGLPGTAAKVVSAGLVAAVVAGAVVDGGAGVVEVVVVGVGVGAGVAVTGLAVVMVVVAAVAAISAGVVGVYCGLR